MGRESKRDQSWAPERSRIVTSYFTPFFTTYFTSFFTRFGVVKSSVKKAVKENVNKRDQSWTIEKITLCHGVFHAFLHDSFHVVLHDRSFFTRIVS